MREVSKRLGISAWGLYQWVKHYAVPPEQRKEQDDQAAKIRKLEAELRRVTEERDILKRPRRTSPKHPGEVRVYQGL